jgi:hypothetical protein
MGQIRLNSTPSRRRRTLRTTAIDDRISEIYQANPSRQLELTIHHLQRALGPVCYHQIQDIGSLNAGLRAGGRTLSQWLRAGALKKSLADRVRPAIEGLRVIGHTDLAVDFDRDFTDWERRCDALAASCPRAMPDDKQARKRLIDQKTSEAEALIAEMISLVGRYADRAGVDLQPGSGFRDVMAKLLHAA